MRKVFFVIAALSGMCLLTAVSASTAPVGGAVALHDAVKSTSVVATVAERCRVTCWRYAGERICRKRCYEQ
jgi:hypothetical protein